jgi:hypothetical protein
MVGKGSDGRVLGKRKQDIKEVWKANMPVSGVLLFQGRLGHGLI